MGEAFKLLGIGAVVGIVVAALIYVAAWLHRKGVSEAWLTGGSLALLGIAILAGSLYPRSLSTLAEAQVRKLDIDFMGMRLKMPCAGITDTGFVVNYRKRGEEIDRQGRVCRDLTGGPWKWHPDTNDIRGASILQ